MAVHPQNEPDHRWVIADAADIQRAKLDRVMPDAQVSDERALQRGVRSSEPTLLGGPDLERR